MANHDDQVIKTDAERVRDIPPDSQSAAEMREFEHRHQLQLKRHFHKLFVAGLYVAWLAAMLVLLIRAFILVAPHSWCWMDDTQVQSLDKILFSGSVGGILGRYINQVIPPNSKK
jgi:hypothetical protein